jgi:predicted DCC family thiol-disulfide oxidoreductase YuxK
VNDIGWVRRTPRDVVLYDGACGLCQRSILLLGRFDVLRRLEFVNVRDWEGVQARFAALGLDEDRCLEEMHVILPGGRVETGFDAYRAMSWVLPGLLPFAPLLYIPGVPVIGRAVYRSIARRRQNLVCTLETIG